MRGTTVKLWQLRLFIFVGMLVAILALSCTTILFARQAGTYRHLCEQKNEQIALHLKHISQLSDATEDLQTRLWKAESPFVASLGLPPPRGEGNEKRVDPLLRIPSSE